MAINIQEEKQSRGGWFGFGITLVVLVILGVAFYYLFFVQPELIDTVAPLPLQSIDQLTQLQFDPAQVVQSPFFTGLRQLVPAQTLPPAGNASPFGVF
jgi:hypothetical protein